FRRKEEGILGAIPVSVAPKTDTPVAILGQNQRTVRRGRVNNVQVEDPVGIDALPRIENLDLPGFLQHRRGMIGREIDVLMAGTQPAVNGAAPRRIQPRGNDGTRQVTLVPEIGCTVLEPRARPGRPDAVVMYMGGRVIICDQLAGRSKDGMDVAATLE